MSVYHVPDADWEKEAGRRRMWSDLVKVNHSEEHLDTDTHIFCRESKFPDWSAYGAIQSVTQEAFFALGMGCLSPDITVKYPVSRHPCRIRPLRPPRRMRPQATVCWRTFCHRT